MGRLGCSGARWRVLWGAVAALVGLSAGGIGASPPSESPPWRDGASQPEGGWSLPGDGAQSSPVADAAMEGDRETVQALIRSGADVDAAQGDGMTALHWAAQRGDAELARLLLEAGARGSVVTRLGGYTPLHLAARAGAGPVVRLLVEGGAPADLPAEKGTTPLHFAAASGSIEAVQVLLSAGADVDAVEFAWQQTPLIFAASGGHGGVSRLLLDAGADGGWTTRVVDIPSRSAADAAAGRKRAEVLEAFREADGGDGNWRPTPAQVQAAIAAGQEVQRAAEELAATAGPEEPTGAEGEVLGYPQMVGKQGGLTPLLHAVREGHREAVAALLDGGVDLEQVSAGDGTSPLLMAVLNGHLDLAGDLLERGADPNVASQAGASPLYATVNVQWAPKSRYPQPRAHEQQQMDYLELMALLLDAGADPNARLDQHLWYMSYTFDLLSVDNPWFHPLLASRLRPPTWRPCASCGPGGRDPPYPPPEGPRSGGRRAGPGEISDPSGLPPIPVGLPVSAGPFQPPPQGWGRRGYAANRPFRHAPDGWSGVPLLVEGAGSGSCERPDQQTATNAVHHAAARGQRAHPATWWKQGGRCSRRLSRKGQSTVGMTNRSGTRAISPSPETNRTPGGPGGP